MATGKDSATVGSSIRSAISEKSGGRSVRLRRLMPLLVLLVAGFTAWQTGVLRLVDLRLAQMALHFLDTPGAESRQILLVTPDTADADSADYSLILNTLASHQPRAMVLTHNPPSPLTDSLTTLLDEGRLIIGRQLLTSTVEGERILAVEDPDQTQKLAYAILGATRDIHGLHDGQFAFYVDGDQLLPTPVALLGRLDGRPVRDFAIDFANAWTRLPQITWSRIRSGGLIEELVRGRVVLVGHPEYLSTATVSSLAGSRTPGLLLEALAIDTYLEDRAAYVVPLPVMIAAMLLTLLTGLFVFQWLSYGRTIWTTVWLSLGFLIGAPLARLYLNIEFSATMLVSAITFAALTVLYFKLNTEDEEFRKVLLSASLTLQQNTSRVHRKDDPWPEAANLVSQIFVNQRFALVSLDGSRRVVEKISVYNGTEAHVTENRRDIRRSPYADAIAQRKPLDLTASESYRPFFVLAEEERQLIVALRDTEDLYGFLIVGITDAFQDTHSQADDLVRSVAIRVAELLRATIPQDDRKTGLVDYLRLRGGKLVSRTVSQVGELVGSRLSRMEEMFDQMGTATIVYDLFGNVVYSNQRMVELMGDTDIKPYELNAANFLAELTRLDAEQARRQIRDTILTEETVQLVVRSGLGRPGTRLYVNLRIVADSRDDQETMVGSLDAVGLMFEIVDMANSQRLGRSKEALFRHLDYEIRTRLGSMIMSAEMLRNSSVPENYRSTLLEQITSDVHRATALLDESQDILHQDKDHDAIESVAEPAEILAEAVAMAREYFGSRDVNVQVDVPTLSFLIKGDMVALIRSISLILQILVRDTPDEGTVRVKGEQQFRHFALQLENEGYGIPESQLQAYLSGADQNTSSEFRELREALLRCDQSGITFAASSEVARGMSFQFEIPRVLTNESAA